MATQMMAGSGKSLSGPVSLELEVLDSGDGGMLGLGPPGAEEAVNLEGDHGGEEEGGWRRVAVEENAEQMSVFVCAECRVQP